MHGRSSQVDDIVKGTKPDELKMNKLVAKLKQLVKGTGTALEGYYELSRVNHKFPAYPHEATHILSIKGLLFNSLRLLDRMR